MMFLSNKLALYRVFGCDVSIYCVAHCGCFSPSIRVYKSGGSILFSCVLSSINVIPSKHSEELDLYMLSDVPIWALTAHYLKRLFQ